jgi:hypothetical protein
MAEVTFTPLTEAAPALLNRFQAEAGIYPFRTTRDGARSYALGADTIQLDGLDAMLDGIEPGWRAHLSRTP